MEVSQASRWVCATFMYSILNTSQHCPIPRTSLSKSYERTLQTVSPDLWGSRSRQIAPFPGWTLAACVLLRRAACHDTKPARWALLAIARVSCRIAPRALLARCASRTGSSSLQARACSCRALLTIVWAGHTGRTGISSSWAQDTCGDGEICVCQP